MRNLFGLFVLVSGVVHAAPIFLARVGLGASEGLTAVAPLAAVVADLGDFCLVRASDAELSSLAAQGFDVAVLDRVGDEDYYFVQAAADFDQDLLAGCCRVLDRYARGFIVAATEEGVRELNRMPVELARVAREPVLLSGRSARLPALPAVDDSLVWRLVNSVDADTVLGNIRRLQNFLTRYSTTESLRQACSWMRAKLTTFGCDSAWLDTWSSQYAPNVVGVKTGKTTPGLIYIIDGHIDNTSDRQPDSCPGADDNASGTAAVIEAARVFADVDFACTVWFIGFSGEEQGLLGSGDFAQRCRARGDSVCGVFNFDMISYGRQDLDSFRVIGTPSNPDCSWLIDFYIAQADTFSALKPIRIMDAGARYSDHSSFWDQGYVAFCGIEDDFTPEYHTLGDTIGPLYYVNCGTNNWLMATEAIRAAVASIAKLAGASPRTGVEEETPSRPVRIARVIPTVGRAPVALRFTQKPPRGTSVEIYNGDGRLVDALPVSNSAAEWQGSAAGVYFLRLTDGGVSSAAKVVLTD